MKISYIILSDIFWSKLYTEFWLPGICSLVVLIIIKVIINMIVHSLDEKTSAPVSKPSGIRFSLFYIDTQTRSSLYVLRNLFPLWSFGYKGRSPKLILFGNILFVFILLLVIALIIFSKVAGDGN